MALDPDLVDRLEALVVAADPAMWIATAATDDERSGCLVGFVTQGSIEPWRLLVCLSTDNHTAGVAAGSTHLAVHLVPEAQHDLGELFATETGDEVDKFERCAWRRGPAGTVLLDGLPVLVGRIADRIPFGDHVGYLLEPVAVEGPDPGDGPLLRLHDAADWSPGHPRETGTT